MSLKLTFWGGVETVTGSMHEVRADGRRFILDCGLYQGRRKEAAERNRKLPLRARSLDGVLLSHAHIDHSGNLPSLAKNGYEGPIYATPATADLCAPMLKDSAYLQERDAEFLNKRFWRRRRLDPRAEDGKVQPIYTMEDAGKVLPLFHNTPYHKAAAITGELACEYFDAGHILGAASMILRYQKGKKRLALAFSGDIGRPQQPILRDPERLADADYLILESTYGGRLHKPDELVREKLGGVIRRTAGRGGKIIVPAFAVGRTQQLVYLLHELTLAKQIPDLPVYVDSPLAVNVTDIYRSHAECFDKETLSYLDSDQDPFGFHRLRYVRDVSESKALNDVRYPMVVISASGMCEGGRILHHLRNNIEDGRNTILIPGFQAAHTLGRKLIEGHEEVPILGDRLRVRAEVVKMNELSGHADQQGLLRWVKPLAPRLKRVFIVHGEPAQSQALADALEAMFGLETEIPKRGDSFTLT